MQIRGSQLTLAGRSEKITTFERKETLRMWVGDARPDFEGRGQAAAPSPQGGPGLVDRLTLSGGKPAPSCAEAKPAEGETLEAGSKEQVHILLIEKMIEMLTGRKVKIRTLEPGQAAEGQGQPVPQEGTPPQTPAEAPARAGYGIEYDATESRRERETLDFRASGAVSTSDGREIRFDLSLRLDRESLEQTVVSFRAGDGVKVDPLVVNFDGNAASLTDSKFAFDLDADGDREDVSFVSPGSGFLVLDREGTGAVADGRQLFGPTTGDGFRELSAGDSDGNGWIDEGDAVYKDLRIWTRDEAGNDVLSTLAEKRVGAIYLGNVAADYALEGSGGQENGEIRRTGVWLSEDGTAGTVQQVDLAV
jgi:hypothetical protein